jgi:predicted acyltransferase
VRTPDARLLSLDVFRGATIAAMILVNNPGPSGATYPQLQHAVWHGWTFTDTIFPFFLWIVGVAMTLSFAKRVERGDDRGRLLLHSARRAGLIFLTGLFLNGFPYFDLATIRIPGVLQRIAVCYLIAAAIYLYTGLRGQIVWIAVVCTAYWLAMTLIPVPGYGPGVLEPVGNFSGWVDSQLLAGHLWRSTKVWDPEGTVSTLPAIATALLGVLTGTLLRSRLAPAEKTSWMLVWGNASLFAGVAMSAFMPVNKSIWTVPFVFLMAGLALIVFAICYWTIDVHGWSGWTRPFTIFGMNAIAVYVFAGLLARVLGLAGWRKPIFLAVFAPIASPRNASLLFAISFDLVCFGLAWVMYKRKWFLRF